MQITWTNLDYRGWYCVLSLLGLLLLSSLSVASTPEEAYQQGQTLAQQQDFAAAIPHYQVAAEQGHANAQFQLGRLYAEGQGVTRDDKQAFMWLQKAAQQGVLAAQNNLGVLYQHGRGTEQDYMSALYWYEKAAKQGAKDAQTNLQMLHSQLYRQYREDFFHTFGEAQKGHMQAQYKLGLMLNNGIGTRRELSEAFKWFQRAARQNHPDSQLKLALLYYHGQGVEQDLAQARYWLEQAALQLHKPAFGLLGTLYRDGKGGDVDLIKAYLWFSLAEQEGDAVATQSLAALTQRLSKEELKKAQQRLAVWQSLRVSKTNDNEDE